MTFEVSTVVWGFRLTKCDAMLLVYYLPTFQRHTVPSSSRVTWVPEHTLLGTLNQWRQYVPLRHQEPLTLWHCITYPRQSEPSNSFVPSFLRTKSTV